MILHQVFVFLPNFPLSKSCFFFSSFQLGRLVFERIRDKCSSVTSGSKAVRALPENFTPEEVPESAKETCRNWFYKVASIRELIPRLYLFITGVTNFVVFNRLVH